MGNWKLKIAIGVGALAILGIVGIFLTKSSKSFEYVSSPTVAGESVQTDQVVPTISARPVKIIFVGDMMFDRYIRQTAEKKGTDFIFAGVKDALAQGDLVVGNLEGPVTNNPSVSVRSEFGSRNNYIFTFSPEIVQKLRENNIGLVTLGNNHILNFKEEGLVETKQNLQAGQVDFFGDPAGQQRYFIWKKNNLRLGFVTYNQFEKDAVAKTLQDIQNVKQEKIDRLIVYTHWGKEFTDVPEADIRNLAHQFIDAGADLIIGSHPHVIQSQEEYRGKKIYYSLGNFIFDQFFDPRTQKGLVVTAEIQAGVDGIKLQESAAQMKTSGQTVLEITQ